MIEYDADGVWLIGDMSLCDIIASVSCVSPTCVDDMKDDAVKHADRGQGPQWIVGNGASFYEHLHMTSLPPPTEAAL